MKKNIQIVISLILISFVLVGCTRSTFNQYGVFLSLDYESLPDDVRYETLVIDAQYYTKEEIDELHRNNGKIYSYLNVGAIEDFRDYYSEYQDITLGPYENWPEEYFVDVSNPKWQEFLVNHLAKELKEKGVDGLFIDNADVYDEYPEDKIYKGLTAILSSLHDMDLDIVINGGDVYIQKYLETHDSLETIIDGVNQEGVFTTIDWKSGELQESSTENQEYFLEYLEKVDAAGGDIYLLEYTDDQELSNQILNQANRLGYILYISDSVELDG